MEESARRVGAAVWAEQGLYEVVGRWSPSGGLPAVKVYFASVSQHHAWRAQLWLERLPARLASPASAGELVQPPSAGARAAMEALCALGDDASRLAAYCRVVLVWGVVSYRRWERLCSPASDRPVSRAIAITLADLLADWQEGCALLADVLSGSGKAPDIDTVARAASASAHVERLLLGAGSS